ncbi:diheme cytochrome c [Magnetospirillum sulfuroxidans]|uniref:Diheme cytochrome c n=1 Tax=Magnetospirillum sulfuroxidans TaxID=611300 RepID=A0ABS5IEG6_9PROT|nr:diheme cytochrome c [Magnetospirillum sulfuroxidans]MBR9972817.1 diheme cytochrome c [Magnetospirillum sulfuroxidans]
MRRSVIALAVLMTWISPALAEDWVPPVTDPLVQKECGACHMAFQPAFLPARSWNRMMDELSDHFGEDASLPADKTQAIRAYLTANAGDVQMKGRAWKYMKWVSPGGTPQKITENPDFERKHRFADKVWKDPKVVTKSNCPACHRAADKGYYEDD